MQSIRRGLLLPTFHGLSKHRLGTIDWPHKMARLMEMLFAVWTRGPSIVYKMGAQSRNGKGHSGGHT